MTDTMTTKRFEHLVQTWINNPEAVFNIGAVHTKLEAEEITSCWEARKSRTNMFRLSAGPAVEHLS